MLPKKALHYNSENTIAFLKLSIMALTLYLGLSKYKGAHIRMLQKARCVAKTLSFWITRDKSKQNHFYLSGNVNQNTYIFNAQH